MWSRGTRSSRRTFRAGDVYRRKGHPAGVEPESSYWGHEDRLALRWPPEWYLGSCMEGTLSVRQGDTGVRKGFGLNHV